MRPPQQHTKAYRCGRAAFRLPRALPVCLCSLLLWGESVRVLDLIAGCQSRTATCLLGREALFQLRCGGEVEEWTQCGRRENLGFIVYHVFLLWDRARLKLGAGNSLAKLARQIPQPCQILSASSSTIGQIPISFWIHDLIDWKKGLGHQSAALDRMIFILCEHQTLCPVESAFQDLCLPRVFSTFGYLEKSDLSLRQFACFTLEEDFIITA